MMGKSCDERCENGMHSLDEMGLTSIELSPRNTPKRDFLNKCYSSLQQSILTNSSSHRGMSSILTEQKYLRPNKQRKEMKSKNLRVCFASMNEELISLDHQWKKIEEMILSYEKRRDKIGRDLKEHVRDIELLKEK